MLNRKRSAKAAMVSLLAVSFGGSLLMPITAQARDIPADHFDRVDGARHRGESRFGRFDDRLSHIAARRERERREREERRELELRRERELQRDRNNWRFHNHDRD